MITFFLYKTRKQSLPSEYYIKNVEALSIDLKPVLTKRLNTNLIMIKVMPHVIVLLMYVFIMGMIVVGQGPEGIQEIRSPSSTLFKVALIVFALMATGAFLAHLKLKEPIATLKKALSLAQNKPLYFKINQNELTIPVIALTNPAFWRATDKNLFEIVLPLQDILSLEVYPKAGKAPSQYLVKVSGESQYLGNGALGGSHFGFGIKREYLAKDEKKILSFFQDNLGERFIIGDQLI